MACNTDSVKIQEQALSYPMLKKFFLGLFGFCLLPAGAGLATALYQILVGLQMEGSGTQILNRFLLGAGAWVLFFLLVSRPVRSYILAHELSHLLAAWMSGIRAGRLKVGRNGGSVEVARSSLWIALAPYLIPFYSLLLIFLHFLAQLWWDPTRWTPWLPLALGITWCFHFTFTLYALSLSQSDIGPYGRICAYSIILTGNLLWICLALVVINPLPLRDDLLLLLHEQQRAYSFGFHKTLEVFFEIKNAIFQG